MKGIIALNRARRLLIAVLAFVVAIGFAFIASTGDAEAARDIKNYSATVQPPTVNAGADVNSFLVTFKNEGPTETQRAGAFQIDFGEFDNVSIVGGPSADGDLSWTGSVDSNGVVEIHAASGGNRIYIDDEVTVNVRATAPSAPGPYTLETAGDQQAGGDFKGGSAFDPPLGGDPVVEVVSTATQCGRECPLGDGDWNANLACSVNCSYQIVPDEDGAFAVFDVFSTDKDENGLLVIEIVLVTKLKGTSPGTAGVDVEGFGALPACGTNGPPNCVHIQRERGHTRYEVFWTEDPRFKFR